MLNIDNELKLKTSCADSLADWAASPALSIMLLAFSYNGMKMC